MTEQAKLENVSFVSPGAKPKFRAKTSFKKALFSNGLVWSHEKQVAGRGLNACFSISFRGSRYL
jgi:hypothetical protein